jgi:ubiquinone/menaquinone biosynthesis C-methylase UbiE
MEQSYVLDFYNNNSKSFDSTRYLPWPIVKSFVESVRKDSTICDVGCGNGKNQFRKDIKWTSCDNSVEMCKIVNDAQLCDCTSLPYKNEEFDHAICIAVIHHLASHERRLKAVKEIYRILKPGGKALISVWASQPKFGCGDQVIGWNNKQNQRYIHFFTYDEIKSIVSNDFNKFTIKFDYNNFFIELVK